MSKPSFRNNFDPQYNKAVEIAEGIQRITCPNKSAFTFHGTNSYLIGKKDVTIIDPGPVGYEEHLQTILKALSGRNLTHILITHTHVDHSPLSKELSEITGAKIYAEGPHRPARELHLGEHNFLDASGDKEFVPHIILNDGDIIKTPEYEFEAVFTPGHTTNHMAFSLLGKPYLFSGDHVMAWATSIVAPPDGSMSQYMNSLEKLSLRNETVYFPGHGGRLEKAKEFVRGLKAHRRMRETAILHRIRKGDRTIPEIVAVIYKETDKRLHSAAALSVFAHIEDLVMAKRVSCESKPALDSSYYPT